MTSSIRAASPTIAYPYARASAENLNTAASLGPLITSAQASGLATASLADPAERVGLTTGGNTAGGLREQAVSIEANTIRWTPWERAQSTAQNGLGNWINTSV